MQNFCGAISVFQLKPILREQNSLRDANLIVMKFDPFYLDDVKTFGALVLGNPLYLVTSSDTCTILHDGARYNAMHMCAQKNRKMVAHNLINVISSAAFWELLYPNDIDSSRVNRMDYMLDLYLNTPDKHCGETALHFAAKFGFQDMLELISSHPRTSRNPQNINGLKPSQVCGLRCTGFIPKFNIDAGPCYVGCYVSASDLSMFKFKLLSPDFDEKAKSHNDSVMQKRNGLIDFETDFELEAYIGPATEAKCKAIMTDLQKRKRSIIVNYVSKMSKFLNYRKMRFEICRDGKVRLKEKFLASDKFLNVSDNLVNLIQQCELFLRSENKKFFNTSISQQLELSFSKLHSKFEELNCSAADSSLGSLTASFANLNIDSSFNQSFNLNDSMMPSVNGSCASILSDTCHDDLSSLDTKFRTWNEFDDSNDDFKTPPASPVANFVDAIDTPFISFCNCEPTEFWQHSELLSVLNNYLISQYFEYVSEHDPTQTESYPLLSSWCEKLKSTSSDILADKSTKTSLNCKTCNYCVHEKFNVFASLSDFEFDPFCLYLN